MRKNLTLSILYSLLIFANDVNALIACLVRKGRSLFVETLPIYMPNIHPESNITLSSCAYFGYGQVSRYWGPPDIILLLSDKTKNIANFDISNISF